MGPRRTAVAMKVLHVINQLGTHGGAEVSLRGILLQTQSDELQHGLALLRPGESAVSDLSDAGVVVFEPRPDVSRYGGWVRHVSAAIRSFRPDVVHTTLADADFAGRVAARLHGVPAVSSLVNTPYDPVAERDRLAAPWKRRVVRETDRALGRWATVAFHAVSEPTATHAREVLGVRAPIHVVPRGRDVDALGGPATADRARQTRTRLGLDSEATVLLTVGRQDAQKGHMHLLHALEEPPLRDRELTTLIAGQPGAVTPALRRRVEQLPDPTSVRLLGTRSDIGDLLCAADVFVFPSLFEGFSGALLEAMAMGVPIVASDIPANREVVGDTAGLVPPADAAALAGKLAEVIDEPDAAATRAKRAEERFRERFTIERTAAGMERFWRSAASDAQPE